MARWGIESPTVVTSSGTENRPGYRLGVDQDEFTRRIEIYLQLDFPRLVGTDDIASALGQRLFSYLRPGLTTAGGKSATLSALLPPGRVLLLFWASWDGSAGDYHEVVSDVANQLSADLVRIDVDDPIGGAVARLHQVSAVPAVAEARSPRLPIVGVRTAPDLLALLARPGELPEHNGQGDDAP